MSVLEVATAHARERRSLADRIRQEFASAWSMVDRARISESWSARIGVLLPLLTGAQYLAAGSAGDYVAGVLDAQGLDPAADGFLNASALAGVASDGRDLASLLAQPGITAKVAIARGATVDRAMAAGGALAELIGHTQVADAGRVADQVALTVRPQATGYVRMIVGGTCSRCIVLAGRWYRYNAGFNRHPRCLPAGVAVSGPATLAATRRRFEGELVVVSTASGQRLPITGNHPVLTDRGWIPAHLLQEGDHVVRSTRSQGATALVVPDEDQVPSRIEDLWRPDSVVSFDHVPTAAEDFHGDGGHGEVDVVLADRLLWNGLHAPLGQFAEQEQFALRVTEAALLAQLGATDERFLRLMSAADGLMGSGCLPAALIGGLTSSPDLSGCGHVPDLHSGRFEPPAHHVAGDAEAQAQAVFTLSGAVGRGDVLGRDRQMASRWDAPAGPFTVESRAAYAARGEDLRLRLSGQVELDRVVEVSRVEWSGHVYNLTSAEGWFSANGLIVSNCDCIGIPGREDTVGDLRTDPAAAFRALDRAEQDRVFGQAGAEAIRSGADISQAVNARRGMYTADGRLYTREAATRRRLRLMPEQIFRQARDRDDAIRLLRLHGYL